MAIVLRVLLEPGYNFHHALREHTVEFFVRLCVQKCIRPTVAGIVRIVSRIHNQLDMKERALAVLGRRRAIACSYEILGCRKQKLLS